MNKIEPTYDPELMDSHPFADELRRVFLGRRNDLLMTAAVIAAIVFGIFLWIEWSQAEMHIEMWKSQEMATYSSFIYRTPLYEWIAFVMLTFVVMAAGGAMMFPMLGSKQQRVTYLMQPVSAQHKFWAQWLRFYLFPIVVLMVSALLADLLRPVIFTSVYFWRTTHFTTIWPYLTANDSLTVSYLCFYLPLSFYFSSLFAYGSVRWPRNSFAKTFTILFVSFLILLVWWICWRLMLQPDGNILSKIFNSDNFAYIATVLVLLGSANFAACYLRLKETDVQ